MVDTAPALAPVEVLERTRRGERIASDDLARFVAAWNDGTATDAQMAAWCMAACMTGVDSDAVAVLTRAMVASGKRLELATLGPTGDVRTTGGLGGPVAIVAAPLAAALGVRVASVTGRGIGHAGGTADKLAAIPGLRVDMELEDFVRQVRDVGIAVAGRASRLAPLEARLRVLRDQTGTVAEPGLVAASVMSRAIAAGAGAIALDVRAGADGWFPDAESAAAAARAMAELGAPFGRRVGWLVSEVEQPVGMAVGNSLEVRAAAEVLNGRGARPLREIAERLAGAVAELAGVVPEGEGRASAAEALDDGSALAAGERWIEAQGGPPRALSDDGALPRAQRTLEVSATDGGWLVGWDLRRLGEVARRLGAGRLHPQQAVDPVVGIELLAEAGEAVEPGMPVAMLHVRDDAAASGLVPAVVASLRLSRTPPGRRELVLARSGDA